MSITGLIKGKGKSGLGWGSTADEVIDGVDLRGKRFLVTGCNSGIGFETMRALAARGARVYGAARSSEKAEAATTKAGGDTVAVVCELTDPESVRDCAQEVKRRGGEIDGIVCNAGIMALPQRETLFGYEKQFFTNHMGHFILVTELVDALSDQGRVVVLSSNAHKTGYRQGIRFDDLGMKQGYSGWKAYGHSKLANLLFARELGRRFAEEKSRRVACAVHPGVIATNLARHMNPVIRVGWDLTAPLFMKSIAQGAATQTWAVANPEAAASINGEYLVDCNVGRSSGAGRDAEMARNLWEKSEEIAGDLLGAAHQKESA